VDRTLPNPSAAPEITDFDSTGWTFRDPAGRLHLEAQCALRHIQPGAETAVRDFLESPLRRSLEESGELIRSVLAGPGDYACIRPGELWLQHPRIFPIAYPWEWTTAQWRAAAQLTLSVAERAVKAGWLLKDATPLNVVFSAARPVLVDALSLQRRDPHCGIWPAYGQFVRTFLLPLVAAKCLSWPLENTLFWRDGYEPRTIYGGLYPWQRLNPYWLDVVTLATLFESRQKPRRGGAAPVPPRNPEAAEFVLLRQISRLRRQTDYAARQQKTSAWIGYSKSATHYGANDVEAKQSFVSEVLVRCKPGRLLDIGANTGTYSVLAAEAGADVVAVDHDAGALEVLWKTAAQRGLAITPLVANIARPTPAVGWKNSEQLSLLDRLEGQFDFVLMLAVIHHLILREQLPLRHIAELCSSLTRRWILLEWVPPSDPMYQEWLRGRDDLYGRFTEDDLFRAFSPYFQLQSRQRLENGRVLLLFERW